MEYYTNLFSPDTYETFTKSSRTISGFRATQKGTAERIVPGDRFICYMTKLSRWTGVLQVEDGPFVDETPIFYPTDDPFIVRFRVRVIGWLPKDRMLPIHEPRVWQALSFTRNTTPGGYWLGPLRRSLQHMKREDGAALEQLIAQQLTDQGETYPVDEEQFRKLAMHQVRRTDKTVAVSVPQDEPIACGKVEEETTRESCRIQALLARIGEQMNFKVWIPKNDRGAVTREWQPHQGTLIETLPLNYDETTLSTIEQIDVLWLNGRAIARAFEVEHTTAVYSGILRMADLLALQPNMDIKLHIVAPEARREKVFTEIQRPVFSLLEKGPLSESCTYLSYDSLRDVAELPHLNHLSDSVLEEYAEQAE